MARQYLPTDEQIAAWRAGGYVVVRTSLTSDNGFCRANNVVYSSLDDALTAAARLDRPSAMTSVNYALPA